MEEHKKVTLVVRMTEAEKLKLKINAEVEGLELSSYIRSELSNIKIKEYE